MQDLFPIEQLLVEGNILFVASSSLSNYLTKASTKYQQEMVNIEAPTLWELRVDSLNKQEILLHIELFDPELLITLSFNEDQLNLLKENHSIEILGILIDYYQATSLAQGVIFVTDIKEGLAAIIAS